MTHTRVPSWAKGTSVCVTEALRSRHAVCHSNTCITAVLLLFSAVSFFAVSVVFVLNPLYPSRAVMGLHAREGNGSFCLDTRRMSHYATVQLNMGTPARTYNLMLRLDVATDSPQVTIHNPAALLSESVQCDDSEDGDQRECTDRAIVTSVADGRRRDSLLFTYKYGDRVLFDKQAQVLDLDGEIALCRGCSHFLLSREYCVSRRPEEGLHPPGLSVSLDDQGQTSTTVEELRNAGAPWSNGAAAAEACVMDEQVRFMPASLYTESSSLLFETADVQELAGSDAVKGMREAMEAGSTCAASQDHLAHHAVTYQLRCTGILDDTSQCETSPAFTFHRVAAHRIFVYCSSESCEAIAEADASLESLPDRDDHSAAYAIAFMRLLLMLLAASIVWIRSDDADASVDKLLKRMVVYAIGGHDEEGHPVSINKFDVMLDGRMVLLGALACMARFAVILHRRDDFVSDGLSRVQTIEFAASILAIVHWLAHALDYAVVRLNVWDARDRSPPERKKHDRSVGHKLVEQLACNMWRGDALATLGGSAAVVDVSCATIIAFTDTPVRSGSHNFDAVARLLTAVLIALTGICRCWFSIAITGVLWQHDHSASGRLTALLGMLFWLLQTAAIASVICYLFVLPLASHITRRLVGDPLWAALSLLAFISTLAGPRITANSSGIAEIRRNS